LARPPGVTAALLRLVCVDAFGGSEWLADQPMSANVPVLVCLHVASRISNVVRIWSAAEEAATLVV
jgi:hypothetical protein